MLNTLLVLSTLTLVAQTLPPQDTQAVPQDETLFLLGPGVLYIQNPYKGVDADIYPVPLFIFRGERLSVFGPRATYSLFGEKDRWGVEALFRLRLEGYEDDDSRYLRGMDDRDGSLELGLRYIHDLDFAVVSTEFSHDILGEHDGYELRFTLNRTFNNVLDIESLRLTPIAGVNWRSGDLNDYYYGVRSSEAVPGRRAYEADGAPGFLTALQADYKLSDRWSLFGLVSFEWLDNEITNSPIVNRDYISNVLLGALYKF